VEERDALISISAELKRIKFEVNTVLVRVLEAVAIYTEPGDASLREIVEIVAEHFHTNVLELKADRRPKKITRVRQTAMYLCTQCTHKSLPTIGHFFGGRDHSTICNAKDRVTIWMHDDDEFRREIELLKQKIKEKVDAD